jgi:hypothetical protein
MLAAAPATLWTGYAGKKSPLPEKGGKEARKPPVTEQFAFTGIVQYL